MLEIEVPNVYENIELREIRNYFSSNRDILRNFFREFSEWYLSKNIIFQYSVEIEKFRKKYKEKNSRDLGLVYAYYISCKILESFLKEKYDIYIENEVIERNCHFLLQAKHKEGVTKEKLAKILVERLFKKNAFEVRIPKPKNVCTNYVSGMCTKFGTDMCDGRYCYDMKEKIFYDPRDLLLANAENGAILIEKPKYFFSYPNYLDNRHSLLVVRSDFILRACNTELESYCYENEVGLSSYGGKTLNKTLFHYNMCLYNYITNDHKTYTFQYETSVLTC